MSGKSAIVTGGAQGIGKAISRVLLKHGYRVAILDVNETAGKQTAEEFSSQFGSGSCVFYKCDVTKTEQLQACYDKVSTDLGEPDVVVNNAGTANEANWTKMVDLNVKSLIDMTYLAVDKMRKDKGGKGGTIVNVASIAGTMALPGLVAYSGTKWAVVGFTQSMVASLSLAGKDWGVSLLTLCPHLVDTPLTAPWLTPGNVPVPTGVPGKECQQIISHLMTQGVISLDELGSAFEKLLQDNKNGAVMKVHKHSNKLDIKYIEHSWTEIDM